jgi:hypothetical protein
MNNFLHVLSLHARPASESRERLQLPQSWPPHLKCDMTKEEIVHEEWVECNSALVQDSERKNRIATILAHPFLEEIVRALRTDVAVWSLDGIGSERKIRWVAEQLVLKVYGIENDLTRTQFEIDASFVNTWYNESRRLSNQFFELVPEFQGPHVSTIKNALNPNGSLDFWIGLYAFNAYRFDLIDKMSVFETAAASHADDGFETLEPTLMCEKLLLNSIRVREHAVMAVLFRAQPILRASNISSQALMKRTMTKSASACNIVSLIKTIVGNMHALRLLINESRSSTLCELIRNTGCWASMRSPSLTILMCAKQSAEFRHLYRAIVQYEIACIRECTALTKIFYSNDIVAQFMEDKEVEEILKKTFYKINICLKSSSSAIDDRIFKDLTRNQMDLIEAFHYESFFFARPSVFFPSFIQTLQVAANKNDNPLMIICNLVTSDKYISLLKRTIQGIDPYLVRDLDEDAHFDDADISIQELHAIVKDEADKRANFQGDPGSFYSLQFNENELLVLSKVIRTLGWGE